VFLLLIGTSLNAQKYGLSVELGQQFGINKLGNYDVPFASETKFSMGNGITRQLMFHLYPDSSNWFVSFGLNQLSGNNVITAQRKNLPAMDYQVATQRIMSLRLISRVSYLFTVKSYSFNFSAGFILPLMSKNTEEYRVKDSVGWSLTTASIRHYTSVGFNGSIGVAKLITPKIKCFLNTDINILNHQVKSKKLMAYESSNGKSFENNFPDIASKETIYRKDVTEIRNNKDVLPQRFNKDQATDKLSYRVTDSSLGFQFGFLFLF